MDTMKRLPDAEFDIMKIIWINEPPMTTNAVMKQLGKDWKAQTLISLLLRLVERGFLRTEKNGKERTYFPLVEREDYLRFETGNFVKQYHDNSFLGLVTTLYDGKAMTDDELDELLKWAKERRG